MIDIFHNLWNYRNFIVSSIRSDLSSRFARSKLGSLWVIINPLAQVLIYALVLSNVLAAKIPGIENKYSYAIYLMAGLLAWTLFNEIITSCLNLFITNGNLMKKMNFPRITLPAIALGTCLLNYIMLLLTMLIILAILGHNPGVVTFWLIPVTLLLTCFALGIGLLLGVLNTFLRDIGQITPVMMQLWFWFTPIVYPETIIPEQFRSLLNLNPIYPIVNACQDILLHQRVPDLQGMVVPTIVAAFMLSLSFILFRRASPEMVDVL